MQSTDIWNKHALLGRKIGLWLFLIVLLPLTGKAQINYLEYLNKKLYFGITLGYNMSDFKIIHSDLFKYHDSVLVVNSSKGPGFNLGIISNLKMSQYFDLRFIPALSFAEKDIDFNLINDSSVTKKIESIYLEFPLSIRFKSQPIHDIRFYVLGGMKYGLDFASNAKARKAEDQITVIKNDFSYEYGVGIQIFFPMFIFSPEIKISHGLLNVHSVNDKLMLSRVIDKLYSHTILISLQFEG